MADVLYEDGGLDFDTGMLYEARLGWVTDPGTARTFTYTFDILPPLPGDPNFFVQNQSLPSEDDKASILQIFEEFKSVANVDFVEDNTDPELYFGTAVLPQWLGVMYSQGFGSDRSIWNDQEQAPYGTDPGSFYYTTWAHEIGHAIGMNHPFGEGSAFGVDTDGSIMSYNPGDYTPSVHDPVTDAATFAIKSSGLQIYDIAFLQHTYGANMNHNAGDDVYTLDDSVLNERKTIWDAGGHDVIDATAQQIGVTIDLRENVDKVNLVGSSVFWLAYGSNIEDAKGSAYSDVIFGNALDNELRGRGGGDQIRGGGGDDTIYGGNGQDVFTINENDVGDVFIADFKKTKDTIEIEDAFVLASELDSNGDGKVSKLDNLAMKDPVTGDLVLTLANGDITLSGITTLTLDHFAFAEADLVLVGGPGDDTLNGGASDDIVKGKQGNDTLHGGDGDDLMRGGFGADVVNGEAGNDTLHGGPDSDTMDGGDDNDIVYGKNGDDFLSGGKGHDIISGGNGNDLVLFDDFNVGVSSAEHGHDLFLMGAGDDFGQSGSGNDIWFGGDGNDIHTLFAIGTGDEGDDRIFGNDGDDTLYTGEGDDTVYGGDGDDAIVSAEGDDMFWGGEGSDQFYFGLPNLFGPLFFTIMDHDTIGDFEPGVDLINMSTILFDGNSFDTNADGVINALDDNVIVEENDDGDHHGGWWGNNEDSITIHFNDDSLTFRNLTELNVSDFAPVPVGPDIIGGPNDDYLLGTTANELIRGNKGNDYLISFGGRDTLKGGEGDDILDATILGPIAEGSFNVVSAIVEMHGGEGKDLLLGGYFNDHLMGNKGMDTLDGGTGDDVLTGGWHGDTFSFNAGELGIGSYIGTFDGKSEEVLYSSFGHDVVTDFGQGPDRLDLTSLTSQIGFGITDLDTTGFGVIDANDDLVDIVDGDMVIRIPHSVVLVKADVDGNPVYTTKDEESTIRLEGVTSISTADIDIYGHVITGTNGDDDNVSNPRVKGTINEDIIYGLDGNDDIRGLRGNDTIDGGAGNDTIIGGGNPDFEPFFSYNIITGGAGDDTYIFKDGAWDYITDFESALVGGGDQLDFFTNYGFHREVWEGFDRNDDGILNEIDGLSIFNDVGIGIGLGASAVILEGIFELSVNDFWELPPPPTVNFIEGTTGDDDGISNPALIGTADVDVIYGNSGNDLLVGLANDDQLVGGFDSDTLLGGAGEDFIYSADAVVTLNPDNILYFEGDSAEDTILFQMSNDGPLDSADYILDFEAGIDKLDFSLTDATLASVDTNSDGVVDVNDAPVIDGVTYFVEEWALDLNTGQLAPAAVLPPGDYYDGIAIIDASGSAGMVIFHGDTALAITDLVFGGSPAAANYQHWVDNPDLFDLVEGTPGTSDLPHLVRMSNLDGTPLLSTDLSLEGVGDNVDILGIL